VLNVNGCKLLGLSTNVTGDSLTYLAGPRWTPSTSSRWRPHVQFLAGGNKLTQQVVYREWETSGFAVVVGSGVHYKLNNALALRVANLDYQHSWNNRLNGTNYQNGLRFTTGLILNMGTW
jgi:hypothetical protein